MTSRSPKPAGSQRSWPVPAALVALSAIPLAAGTLRLIQLAADLVKAAGWVINLAVAEWAIRRPARRRPAPPVRAQQAGALL